MIKLLKNARLYGPQDLGLMDILIAGERIAAIEAHITGFDGAQVTDLEGRTVVPGLVDIHMHITGGGGELGPSSRVPELQLSQITAWGVTTVLGLYGTDGLTRGQEALLAKCRALNQEGITCYCLSGAYRYPAPSLLGDIARDIAFLDPVVGVKTALSDHRSSSLTVEELIRLGSDARLGGLLAGKAGIVVAHMGAGEAGIDPIFEALRRSDIPVKTFIPTHCGRNSRLAAQAARFAGMGGTADFTATLEDTQGGAARVLAELIRGGTDPRQLTLSSDSGGSLPRFDEAGSCTGMDVGTPEALLVELRRLVEDQGIPLETALLPLTENPARVLGKAGIKGRLAPGADADILVLGDHMGVDTLYARGRLMVKDGAPVVRGYFEQA